MKIFEGKSPAERNKLIAAMVLGALALIALTYTFGGMFFGSKKPTVNVKVSPTPTPKSSPKSGSAQNASLPSQEDMNFDYQTTPVVYNPNSFYAPDAGRNIFAFYEPPPPTPYSPTPTPPPTPEVIKTPEPTPTPPQMIVGVTPQTIYAGAKGFRLEVNGDGFTPDTFIVFNGFQLPTTYISPQKLAADVPANFISASGSASISVRTPDNRLYSNQMSLEIQAPPTPQLQYIGMIARRRYNNDTAYFQEQGKPTPISARLNDVVGGRFRLISISADETIFEDVNLGFKHKLALYRPAPGEGVSNSGAAGLPAGNNPGDFQNRRGNNPNYQNNQYNNQYNMPQPTTVTPTGEIPGIPTNIQRATPPPPPQKSNDIDDNDDN